MFTLQLLSTKTKILEIKIFNLMGLNFSQKIKFMYKYRFHFIYSYLKSGFRTRIVFFVCGISYK